MNDLQTKDFIIKHTFPFFEYQLEMEEYAHKNHVPIISRDSLDTLLALIKIQKPKKILELGTAIGYSSIAMALSMPLDGQIISMERNLARFDEAKSNISKMNLDDKITVHIIDATRAAEIVAENAPYDFVFIDAAKGQYQLYFDMVFPYVNDGGLLVSDNIFHKGLVFEEDISKVEKRQRTIYRRMRDYLNFLKSDNTDFYTALLPIGDGLAITYKTKG